MAFLWWRKQPKPEKPERRERRTAADRPDVEKSSDNLPPSLSERYQKLAKDGGPKGMGFARFAS